MSKKMGCCSSCDHELFKATERFIAGHVLEGQIRRAGSPNQDAVRVTFVLMDGTHADMTFCRTCVPECSELPMLWKKVLEQMSREIENDFRLRLPAEPLNAEQEALARSRLVRMVDSPPLGVILSQPWSEVQGCLT